MIHAELLDGLRAWEEQLLRHGCPAVPNLADGASEEQIHEAFAQVGIVPSPEVVTWFSWHNGTRDPSGAAYIGPGDVIDLHQAVATYTMHSQPWDLVFRPDWVPLMGLAIAGCVVAACEPDRFPASRITVYDVVYEPAEASWEPSITQFVQRMVGLYRSGFITWQDGFTTLSGGVRPGEPTFNLYG